MDAWYDLRALQPTRRPGTDADPAASFALESSKSQGLEYAVAGGADYLISGDHHLTDLKIFGTINIVTPMEFLAIFHQE
jgi:hypothetical protein